MRTRWFVARGVAAMLIVAGNASLALSSGATTALAAPVAVGDASAIAPGVEVRAAGAAYAPLAAAAMPVAVGDAVRTDATGFAEVAYLDGSRTRLDVNTEFEVLELVDDAGVATTRTEMAVGRTWHRVESVGSAGGGFVVETSQATATVRGTAFAIECPTDIECTYVVAEGVIELSLADGTVVELMAPSAVAVVDGVAGPIMPVPFDGVFGDPWLADNGSRDAAAGFADAATTYQAHGPAYGSLAGTFTGTMTITDFTCVEECATFDNTPGTTFDDVEHSWETRCEETGTCVTTGGSGVPLVLEGTAYHWVVPDIEPGPCGWDADEDGDIEEITGTTAGANEWWLAPSTVEVRDGTPHVTAYEFTFVMHHEVTEGWCPAPGADELDPSGPQFRGEMTVAQGTATR